MSTHLRDYSSSQVFILWLVYFDVSYFVAGLFCGWFILCLFLLDAILIVFVFIYKVVCVSHQLKMGIASLTMGIASLATSLASIISINIPPN